MAPFVPDTRLVPIITESVINGVVVLALGANSTKIATGNSRIRGDRKILLHKCFLLGL